MFNSQICGELVGVSYSRKIGNLGFNRAEAHCKELSYFQMTWPILILGISSNVLKSPFSDKVIIVLGRKTQRKILKIL